MCSTLVGAFASFVIYKILSSPAIQWSVVRAYLTFPSIMHGLLLTIYLTGISMVLGIIGGVGLAAARLSKNLAFKVPADAYVWFFRGTPLLVQLLFWYNIAIFAPRISLAIPFGPHLASWQTNSVVTPLVASVFGLALNESAYMCEVIRGGLLSIPPGQREAAVALGLTERQSFSQIVLPQAMRSIVPPTGNQVINMLKGSSLVAFIAVPDLLYSVQSIYNQNFRGGFNGSSQHGSVRQ